MRIAAPTPTLRMLTAACLALGALVVLGSGTARAGSAPPIPQGQLAFTVYPDAGGAPEIFVINLDGSERHQLTDNGVNDNLPDWSPDGTRLLEQRNLHDTTYGVMTMDPDGDHPHQVSNDSNDDGYPSWTPDGRILVASYRESNSKIFVMDANGGNATRLSNTDAIADYNPAMSPDGNKIAYESEQSGSREIWVMDTNGGNKTRLTYDDNFDGQPAWSADSSVIVFNRSLNSNDLWSIDAAGGHLTQLTFVGDAGDPAFSPDGAFIVFSRSDGLYTMTPDGQNVTKVPGTVRGDVEPSWRPGMIAGDSDCNQLVDAMDVLHTLQSQAGAPANAAGCLAAANVKCDDALDARDLLLVLGYVAQTASDVPGGCRSIGQPLG